MNRSRWCHWVLESILEPNLPFGNVKNQEFPLYSQNPKNDHFALLVIWSNFLWNCGPNLIKWSIWVYNVDVDQNLWGLTVNWPQLTFSPIQLISRSTVQLTGQKFDSRLETWYGKTYESNMKYESQFEHWRSKNPCANSNPSLGQRCNEVSWAEQTLA